MADTPVQGAVAPNAPEQAAPEVKTEQPNPQMEAFARKERQLRKLQMEIQAEKQRLEGEATKYQTDYLPKSRLQEDPLSVLAEMGYDTQKLSEMLLNAPNSNDPTVRMFQQKIKALEDKQAASEKRAQEAVTQQYEQAKRQIENEAKLLVDGNADYETIKSAGMHSAVTELILQTFEKTGVLMDVAEAAEQVENHLVEEGLKFAKINKIQQKLQPQAPAEQTQPGKQTAQGQIKTITQNLAQPQTGKRLTEKERVARAMAAFNGKLT
jgi:hypothetical protein